MGTKYLVCGLLCTVMCACGGKGNSGKTESTAVDSTVQSGQVAPETSEDDPTAIAYEMKFDSEFFSDAKVAMIQSGLSEDSIMATFTLKVRKALPEGHDENILVSPLKGDLPDGTIDVGVDSLAQASDCVFENEPGKTIQFSRDFTKEELKGVDGFLIKTGLSNPDSAFETAEWK